MLRFANELKLNSSPLRACEGYRSADLLKKENVPSS